ncbi:helix-turn-helix domain-containing protein [Ferruginibacter paludis]|uniref:helix-turn-helix domain-containing protein n=1 Tax=Ferruginibacter paludis TaxID=1310417 RepID=UPI0025B3D615|nr:helix-turn-helix domain-containing protein [Ferruginibacter paludis]MDN3656120.1 helix-turn-helix domain-containing protein [Ferruginibacter paludis]
MKKISHARSYNFKILKVNSEEHKNIAYNRRDYYKISFIITGSCKLSFDDNAISVKGPCLMFFGPLLSYTWQPASSEYAGYDCLFTKDFLSGQMQQYNLLKSPLFRVGGMPAFKVPASEFKDLKYLFKKMLEEYHDTYRNKNDLMCSYVNIILHMGTKMLDEKKLELNYNAAERITEDFFNLLHRQFPLADSTDKILLKTPSDFAKSMHLHVNHLNQVLKSATGRNTNWHLQQQIMNEAKLLLKHTDWPVASVGYSLGFEHPSYFNNYFKRHTGNTPLSYRRRYI